jgi:predicted Fe-Mo cluster-binding NifX family protein
MKTLKGKERELIVITTVGENATEVLHSSGITGER